MSVREHIHDAIQSSIEQSDDDDLPEGTMLMGWVCVAEWMDPQGRRWLSRVNGNAQGEQAPVWQIHGYLHNALFDGEGFDDPDESD